MGERESRSPQPKRPPNGVDGVDTLSRYAFTRSPVAETAHGGDRAVLAGPAREARR